MVSWGDLPNEIVEHILSYCCVDALRNEPGLPLNLFKIIVGCNRDLNTKCMFGFMKHLQFEKRCRIILKGMCVFKSVIGADGNLYNRWNFKSGILHRRK